VSRPLAGVGLDTVVGCWPIESGRIWLLLWLVIAVARAGLGGFSQSARNQSMGIDGQRPRLKGEPDYLRDGDFTTAIEDMLGERAIQDRYHSLRHHSYCASLNTDAAVLTAPSAAGKPAYTAICRMISRISLRLQPTFNAPLICSFNSAWG